MPCCILPLDHPVWHTPGHVLRGHNSGKRTHWGTGITVQQSERLGLCRWWKHWPACLSRKTGVKLEQRGAASRGGPWLAAHGCPEDPGWVSRNLCQQHCCKVPTPETPALTSPSEVLSSLCCCCCCQEWYFKEVDDIVLENTWLH